MRIEYHTIQDTAKKKQKEEAKSNLSDWLSQSLTDLAYRECLVYSGKVISPSSVSRKTLVREWRFKEHKGTTLYKYGPWDRTSTIEEINSGVYLLEFNESLGKNSVEDICDYTLLDEKLPTSPEKLVEVNLQSICGELISKENKQKFLLIVNKYSSLLERIM